MDKWRHYLERGQFIIKMDYENLKFLLQQRLHTHLHTHLQKKGMARLMGLDYVIQYRKGRENKVVDVLSRCTEEAMVTSITMVVPD